MPTLFDPIKIGRLICPDRIWMAPLTRGRATRAHVPTDLMAAYYTQRAAAGLIISEATGITVEGSGWPYAGGRIFPAHYRQSENLVLAGAGRLHNVSRGRFLNRCQ